MTGSPAVILDACVLANFSLADTLLRLAEAPRLFEPKWSEEIIRETIRTLEARLGWPRSLTAHLESELRNHFPEAWVSDYESLISQMTNDEKDRHVLAAAVRCKAPVVATFNLRHFGEEHLRPWGIHALHPQSLLISLLHQDPGNVVAKLKQQATDRSRSLSQLLDTLKATAPDFVVLVAEATSSE